MNTLFILDFYGCSPIAYEASALSRQALGPSRKYLNSIKKLTTEKTLAYLSGDLATKRNNLKLLTHGSIPSNYFLVNLLMLSVSYTVIKKVYNICFISMKRTDFEK